MRSPQITVGFVPETLAQIDQIVATRKQTSPMTSRADVIRELVERGLREATRQRGRKS